MSDAALKTDVAADTATTDTTVNTDIATTNADTVQTATVNNDTASDVTPRWPENWRDLVAGKDEKMQKYLERFNSPADIAKSGLELREKISKGEYKRATQAPSDDEVALKEWRAENGVPETPDKYTTPEGVLFGEEDTPIVNEFLKDMHSNNVPDAFVKPALKWYADLQRKQAEHTAQLDKQLEIATEEELRQEWGVEYRANKHEVENFVKSRFPEDVANALMASADTVKALAQISREINPAVTLFPSANNPSQSLEDEIKSIESKMHTDAYKKDAKMQGRYMQLLEARSRLAK